MTYTPPEGFAYDPPSGRYYRQDGIVNGQQWVTWFDADSGEYEQVQYPAAPQPAPTAPLVARGNASPPPAAMPQPTAPVPQKRGKGILVAVIALVVLVGAVFGGHFR
jgi:hypothetical protein